MDSKAVSTTKRAVAGAFRLSAAADPSGRSPALLGGGLGTSESEPRPRSTRGRDSDGPWVGAGPPARLQPARIRRTGKPEKGRGLNGPTSRSGAGGGRKPARPQSILITEYPNVLNWVISSKTRLTSSRGTSSVTRDFGLIFPDSTIRSISG